MKKPPKNGEPKIKTVNGKQWTWCIHHMAWGMHTPEECKLGKAQAQKRTTSIANLDTVANSAIVPLPMRHTLLYLMSSRVPACLNDSLNRHGTVFMASVPWSRLLSDLISSLYIFYSYQSCSYYYCPECLCSYTKLIATLYTRAPGFDTIVSTVPKISTGIIGSKSV